MTRLGLPSAACLSRPEDRTFEAEVRMFLAQHNKSDAAANRHMVPGVQGNALMEEAASAARQAANDLPSGGQSRADKGDDLAA